MKALALLWVLLVRAQTVTGDAAGAVRVIQADEPVKVVALHFVNAGADQRDVSIEAKNAGPVALRSAWFTLAPPACPKSGKVGAPTFGYGQRNGAKVDTRVVPRGETFTVSVPGKRLAGIARWAKRQGCPDTARPDLVLGGAIFTDGRKWIRGPGGQGEYTAVGR